MSNFEKINIFVPPWVKSQLDADCGMFGILKKDGHTINRNAFLSMVIIGYYDEFVRGANERFNSIVSCLQQLRLPDSQIQQVASTLVGQPVASKEIKRFGKGAVSIPYKPTAKTENIIRRMRYEVGDDSHLPRYIAQLFISYCENPISERERIVFKDKYDLLIECCNKKTPVFISTGNQSTSGHTILPYDIVIGKEELFNFLLCQEINPKTSKPEARAYRMNRINAVSRSRELLVLDKTVAQYLKKMRLYGAQYEINDDEEICVRLTEAGWRLYNTGIYFGKPVLDSYKIEGENYFLIFSCSKNQVELYFRRFGKEAEVLYPNSLRQRLIQFYQSALTVYEQE